MAAEQSVLGAMMISKDAIADVAETLHGVDFYRPSHETIHDAIMDLYGSGEPVDMVTVAASLQKAGELQRIGGAAYLHTLSASVPIAANASYYAEIVREKAILRRLVDAGTKIVQIGYAGEGDVDDIVDVAQAEVYKVTDKRTTEDYAPLSEIMPGVLDEIEAIGNRDAGLYGVPTGFVDLDDLTNGLHPGQMIIVAARPGVGKALALDTPLPTPSGWTTMGEVAVGDELYDAQGRPTRVVAATEVMHEPAVLRGELLRRIDDRRGCRAPVADRDPSRAQVEVVGGQQLQPLPQPAHVPRGGDDRAHRQDGPGGGRPAGQPRGRERGARWRVRAKRLPVPPYVLGAWLGDGHSASCSDHLRDRRDPDVHRGLRAGRGAARQHAVHDQAAATRRRRPFRRLPGLWREVLRPLDVHGLPEGPRQRPGTAPQDRCAEQQAHPAAVPASVGADCAASSSPA